MKRTGVWTVLVLMAIILSASFISAAQAEIYIDTQTKPGSKFEEAKLKSVAILTFETRDIETIGGKVVNYMRLARMFSDDLIKKIYSLAKIEVALGQYEDYIIETDTVDKKKGDLYIDSSSVQRSVRYNCTPFKKIQAVLTGSINRYRLVGDGRGISYIHVTLKLTDSYDGTVYWITDMEGYYQDVIHTIAYTLSSGKYEEPVATIEEIPADEDSSSRKSGKKKGKEAPEAAPPAEAAPVSDGSVETPEPEVPPEVPETEAAE